MKTKKKKKLKTQFFSFKQVFAAIDDYENQLRFPSEDDDVSVSDKAQQFLRRVLCDEKSRWINVWFSIVNIDCLYLFLILIMYFIEKMWQPKSIF